MTKIKITSNPYEQTIEYHHWNNTKGCWEDIRDVNPNTSLRYDSTSKKIFLPFKIKDIIDTIIKEFHNGIDKLEILFNGTDDEYDELYRVCHRQDIVEKILCGKRTKELANASVVIDSVENIFREIRPIIEKTSSISNHNITEDMRKIDESLDNIVPICVFGNYSTGKSTFINSLIGHEVLPKAGEPVTAKIYKISRSIDDTAQIEFEYQGESYKMHFSGEDNSLISGDHGSFIIQSIRSNIEHCSDMYDSLCGALAAINSHDKKQKSDDAYDVVNDIGDVIVINVPFSKNGILGTSKHNFVIFDTPGANSNTHKDHAEILESALESLSNGIPIWMAVYDTLDSNDNAELCDKILNIDALDKRFTMIVVNRADDAELDDIDEKKPEIMGYEAVETMYSNGIYFLSAVMGLGAKIDREFNDKHYRKLFSKNANSYSDPNDRDYERLYIYNIMPEQIKDEVITASEGCDNLVYANSGLFCIEKVMDDFAGRYAAYNKCEMVSIFIRKVVNKVEGIISAKVSSLKERHDELADKLDVDKSDLLKQIKQEAEEMDTKFQEESTVNADMLVKRKESSFCFTAQAFEQRANEIRSNLDSQEIEESKQKKDSAWEKWKQRGAELFQGGLHGLASIGQKLKALGQGTGEVIVAVDNFGTKEKHEDQIVSEKLMQYVHDEYQKSIANLSDELKEYLDSKWHSYIGKFRDAIENLITDSTGLSVDQRNKMSDIVANFPQPDLSDASNQVFLKEKYQNGYLFGLSPDSFESGIIYHMSQGAARIDKEKLSKEYNNTLKTRVDEIAEKINSSCYEGFKRWQNQLLATIEQNITEFNPKLAMLATDIKQKQDEINSLRRDAETLANAISTINSMMSWKNNEEDR